MSATKITIKEVTNRTVKTRFGEKPVYSLVGTDGVTYNYGFEEPSKKGLAIGTTFTGFVDSDKYGPKIDPKSITLGGTAVPLSSTPPPSGGSSGGRGGNFQPKVFPVPVRHGDMAIIRQNSVTNAVAIVADFVATRETEEWPKSLDEWTELVIETAYKLADFSSGRKEEKAMAKLQGIGALEDALESTTED